MKEKASRIVSNPYLWLFLVISGLFGLLFIRFILGDYAYFYLDAGADTFDINYPLYRLFAQVYQGGSFDPYMLNVGLGMDMSSYWFQYLNPLNLMVVLLPWHLIPWGILFATYVKLLVIGIFGYKLMYRWIGHSWGAFAGALLWTFSSYVMLWGQHYGFCTSIMMFTVFLYLVHLFVEDGEKSRNWLLILWITLMLFTNYYFLYMSGIVGALYVIVYLLIRKQSFKKIFWKLLGLAGMGILGIAIGGVCLVPTCNIFMESTRTSSVNSNFVDKLVPYTPKRLCAFVARLFSNNTLGIANEYTGAGNYYEIAMIFTSSLFLLALPYLLWKKETKKTAWVLTICSVILLVLPISGKIFTMNASALRWSFMLCLLEAFGVGLYVKSLLTEKHRRGILESTTKGLILAGVLCGIIFLGERMGYYELDLKYLLLSLVFLLLYAGVVLLWGARGNKVFSLALMGILCVELVVTNYPTINFREIPTRDEVAYDLYNDGTTELWRSVSVNDPVLCRAGKSYESASENDGMVQGYPGMSAYMTTNPASLVELKEMYGAKGISDNFVYFDQDNFLLNTLLGVKYLLTDEGYGLSSDRYELYAEEEGKLAYRNRYQLPFGYLYDSRWEKAEVKKMTDIEKTLAALHGFYFTDEHSDTEYSRAVRREEAGNSLLTRNLQGVDCELEKTSEGIAVKNMGDDPHIRIDGVQDAFGAGGVHTITMKVDTSKKVDMALYYRTREDQDFSQDQIYIFTITPKRNTWTYTIPGDVIDLRIDVSTEISDLTIRELTVNNCPSDNAALEKLRQSQVSEPTWQNNIYQTRVTNGGTAAQMLCVPFLYSEGWKCYLDNAPAEIYNINSGLCGVEIPPGTHQVTLRYEIPHMKGGILLSGGGLLVYIIFCIFNGRKKGKKDRIKS